MGYRIVGGNAGGWAGYKVTEILDFDGDGLADVAISATIADHGG